MKKHLFRSFFHAGALFLTILTVALFAASCSSPSVNPNAPFLGTYYGSLVGNGINNADTIVITAGNTGTSVVMLSRTSIGSSYTLNGTVNGGTLTIPTQTFTYYSNIDTASGAGALSGNNLTINYHFAAPSGSTNFNYTGHK